MTAKPFQHTENVLTEIRNERMRQIKVKGFTPERDDKAAHSWLFGLMEERMILAEAYKGFDTFEEKQIPFVREQLLELAALSAALIERLDREKSAS